MFMNRGEVYRLVILVSIVVTESEATCLLFTQGLSILGLKRLGFSPGCPRIVAYTYKRKCKKTLGK